VLSSAVMIGALTLWPKVIYYTEAAADRGDARQEAYVQGFLDKLGWTQVGLLNLSVTGDMRAFRYTSRVCETGIRVMLLPSSGEAAELAKGMVPEGSRLLFLDDGILSERAPRHAYAKEKLGRLSKSMGLPFFDSPHLLAIAAPADCPVETALPWQLL
jgi:hypothetical protein